MSETFHLRRASEIVPLKQTRVVPSSLTPSVVPAQNCYGEHSGVFLCVRATDTLSRAIATQRETIVSTFQEALARK